MGFRVCVLAAVVSACAGAFGSSAFHTPRTEAANLRFTVQPNNSYTLGLNGQDWLGSAPVTVCVEGTTYSSADGSLPLANKATVSGTDAKLGPWNGTALTYRSSNGKASATGCRVVGPSMLLVLLVPAQADVVVTLKGFASWPQAAAVTAQFLTDTSTQGCVKGGGQFPLAITAPAFSTTAAQAAAVSALSWEVCYYCYYYCC
jgi:hypothetical protein